MIRTLPLLCLPLPAMADVNVVTDIAPIHSITAQIMGDTGTPKLLLPVDADVHHFQFRPSDANALQNADVVIMVGETLTPWLADPVASLAQNASVLSLIETENWEPFQLALREGHDHGDHDDHEGHDDHDDHDDHADQDGHDGHDDQKDDDDHTDHDHDDHTDHDDHDEHKDHDDHADHEGHDDHDDHADHADHKDHDDHEGHDDHDEAGHGEGVDPHAWLNPAVASYWAKEIASALSAADPDNADTYAANLSTFVTQASALDTEIAGLLSDTGPIIWPHDGYQYLEALYSINAAGSVADVHGATPGPERISELQDMISAEGVTCILTDGEINGDWVDVIREGTDVGTAFIDSVGAGLETGPDLYPAMMRKLATAIANC